MAAKRSRGQLKIQLYLSPLLISPLGAKVGAYVVCTHSLAFYLQIKTIMRKIG